MWKEKLPSGKVRYIDRIIDPMTGKAKRISVTITPTGRKKADADAARETLNRKKQKTSRISQKSFTLREVADAYYKYQLSHVKRQTAESYKSHVNTILRCLGEDTLVDKLNAPYISEKLDATAVTYNERLRRLKYMLHWAYRMDMAGDISYLDKLLPKKEPTAREKDAAKYLEHDEMNALLDGMKVRKWNLLTRFLILSGLRIGEAIALDDKDVTDVIHINKTLVLNERYISTTKSDTSTRDINVQKELRDCIAEIRRYVREDEMMYGYRSDLFFPDRDGDYLSYAAYAKYFRENTEKILKRKLTPHSLRHTHTAMLAEAGVPLETISRRLGHADSKITKDVYMHVTNRMKDRDRALLENIKII